ncbi:hypothetical protein [Paraliomyxa miuraensis]|uniref:hypothetical protein n=1 Tax=Paraliomyxa miuraensis TaxID=376150 RepID=UPI00225362B6|nr:hypothetical protein [Paraliomyxa miuraensis]MCX4240921.1 hypothetical protein [Paraliomyxa miuraensis]
MINSRLSRPALLISCVSLLLAACGNKDQTEAKPNDAKAPAAAKAGDAEPAAAKPEEAKPAAAITADGPKGKDAADNHKPLVDALAGLEGCKLDAEGRNIDGDCAAYDAFSKVVDDSEDEDQEAIARTLVNLLGDSSDVVRWSAQSVLRNLDWLKHDALVATGLVALASEKNEEIANGLASDLRNAEEEKLFGDALRPTLEATLIALPHKEAFVSLMPTASECGENVKCLELLANVAAKNPELHNRGFAAAELMAANQLLGNSCTIASEVAVTLAKAPAPAEDADNPYNPHEDAEQIIGSITSVEVGEGDEKQDCAAVLPKLVDEVTALAKAGTLSDRVFTAVLDIDRREDKKSYMEKLTALAEAVKGNDELGADMKQSATDALENWKSEE